MKATIYKEMLRIYRRNIARVGLCFCLAEAWNLYSSDKNLLDELRSELFEFKPIRKEKHELWWPLDNWQTRVNVVNALIKRHEKNL